MGPKGAFSDSTTALYHVCALRAELPVDLCRPSLRRAANVNATIKEVHDKPAAKRTAAFIVRLSLFRCIWPPFRCIWPPQSAYFVPKLRPQQTDQPEPGQRIRWGSADSLTGSAWRAWLLHVKQRTGPTWLYIALSMCHLFCVRITQVLQLKLEHINLEAKNRGHCGNEGAAELGLPEGRKGFRII